MPVRITVWDGAGVIGGNKVLVEADPSISGVKRVTVEIQFAWEGHNAGAPIQLVGWFGPRSAKGSGEE